MTQDSLDKFCNAAGWSVGSDAAVPLVKVGANGTIDTTLASSQVIALVLTITGLLAAVSINGAKVTRLNL
ncbi:lipid-binding SYLF domain-containing protein [Paraburkholderia sp. GAS448]|jgi:lipid-binding SYLF domain-containing protein|uniref:hypothetical protein n=1 Tax=Paraburkholderia sp. GAS448 TaxID=3035136 RepID=UPI003D22F502